MDTHCHPPQSQLQDQHIGGDFFSDLVGTVIGVIAEAFEDKLEKEIFY